MKRFRNILFVAEGKKNDRAALGRAVKLARDNNAHLTVVEVLREIPRELQSFVQSKLSQDFQKIITRETLVRIENLISPFKDEGLQVTADVLVGTPFIEIIRDVLRNGRDLVIMTAKGKRGLREMLFGSTALHVLRKCPCPVWVIKPSPRKKFARILAAVDPIPLYDGPDGTKHDLSVKIIELASALALSEGSTLHVVHAWTVFAETMMRGRLGISQKDIANINRRTYQEHAHLVHELLERHAPSVARKHVHVVKGDPGTLIPKIAKAKGIQLIVMGTVSRTGVSGLLIGNTAERILHRVDCSVLTVKPAGFVSPVSLQDS